MKKAALLAAKIGPSLALLWIALRGTDLSAAGGLIGNISPLAVLLALAVLVVQQTLASVRLRYLFALLGQEVSLLRAIDAVFVGVFFSQTFISFIGGDAMRIWRVASQRVPIGIGARAVLLDRIAGLIGMGLLVVLGMPFARQLISNSDLRLELLVLTLLGAVAVAAFLALSRLPASHRRWRLVALLMDVSSQMAAVLRTPRDFCIVFGLSVIVQALNPVAVYLLAHGLGIDVAIVDLVILVPPVLLLAMLPISFAGWGIRESAMVIALGFVGISREESIAVSVSFGLALIAIGIPGAVLWFAQLRNRPPVQPVER